MTDKTFIHNYLDRYYDVKLDRSGYIFISKETGRAMDNTEFTYMIRKVLTNYRTDEGQRVINVCQEWFDSKKGNATNPIDEYLSDVSIRLTKCEWIITKPSGKIINIKSLWEHFDGQFSQQFLTHYFGEWSSLKVCEESERLMNL
jgi:hypothetical protein